MGWCFWHLLLDFLKKNQLKARYKTIEEAYGRLQVFKCERITNISMYPHTMSVC